MTYEEAATFPDAANPVLHLVSDLGDAQADQEVLINGASSAIGTSAVQIAQKLGSEMTGVCSITKLEMVKSLGADAVIITVAHNDQN